MSKLEAIAASPSRLGLGVGDVVGTGSGVGVGADVFDPVVVSWLDLPLAVTLQPVRTAHSMSDAASVFKFLFKSGMTPLRV
jgi:hypothetical protein